LIETQNKAPGPPQAVKLVDVATFHEYGGNKSSQYMIEWDKSSNFDSPASNGYVDGSTFSYTIGGDNVLLQTY
jgi:hypothetical protein